MRATKVSSILVTLCSLLISGFVYSQTVASQQTSPDNSINWQEYNEKIFEQAQQSNKLILLFGKATWCEWCNKTLSTTLTNPDVAKIVNSNFIPVLVDVDADRNIAIQYKIINLPTFLIINSSHATINEKHGYVKPDELITFLNDASPQTDTTSSTTQSASPTISGSDELVTGLSDEQYKLLMEKQLLWYANMADNGGGQEFKNKFIGRYTTQFAFPLVLANVEPARDWLTTTFNNGLNLLDPIWGGMYAYSTNGDWNHPNYEKLLAVQGLYIRIYAEAYLLTKNTSYLAAAEKSTEYVLNFLQSPDGAFYYGQAAKMNGAKQDENYYQLNDALRHTAGKPAINKSIHPASNGEAIRALTTMYMVTGTKSYLDHAIRAAEWINKNLGLPNGGYRHSQTSHDLYLYDSLSMGRAYFQLYLATADSKYLNMAQQSLEYIAKTFPNPDGSGCYFSHISTSSSDKQPAYCSTNHNISLEALAMLLYHQNHQQKFLQIGRNIIHYLTQPNIIKKSFPAQILLADYLYKNMPMHITIIGSKNDPAAFALFNAALRFPSMYLMINWYQTSQDAFQGDAIRYPALTESAAYFCANNRCSLPLYNPQTLTDVAHALVAEQTHARSSSIISDVTALLPKYTSARAQQIFADILINRNWIAIALAFWSIGLLLAFTPCVFPLLMILTTLLMSSEGIISRGRIFALSITYVISLATTYALVGYLAARLGLYLQTYMQSPAVLITVSLILTALAFSLLGLYKIRLPAPIQHYLISFNSFRGSNSYLGAALMAMVVTLVASPCSAAPLIGILAIIAEIGDTQLGLIALFMMGLGMGTPLLVVGLYSERFVPKVAEWQHALETVFGLLVLAIAIWIASRVISNASYMLLLSALAIVTALYMGVFQNTTDSSFGRFWKAFSIIFLTYGISLFVGVMLGNSSITNPLALSQGFIQQYPTSKLGVFQTISSESDLRNILIISREQKRPVLIDFYASWCESCNQIENQIFTNPDAANLMINFTLVRIDLTNRDEGSLAIARKFNVTAPPAIIFFNTNGLEIDTRLYGDITLEKFNAVLKMILQK